MKHDHVVLAQERAMWHFRTSEWIVPPIVVPVFLLLLVVQRHSSMASATRSYRVTS